MGGKFSSETNASSHVSNSHVARSSGTTSGLGPVRRNTVAVGEYDTGTASTYGLAPRNLAQPNDDHVGTSMQQQSRSAASISLRVPRSGLEWLMTRQLEDGDGLPGDRRFNSTRIVNQHRRRVGGRSLPPFFLHANRDAKCHMCNKVIPAEDIEFHFVMCLTKPRVTYNEDVLSAAAGECAICLDDLEEGEPIARLPCLCIYHKKCIDEWFVKSQTCPQHPPD